MKYSDRLLTGLRGRYTRNFYVSSYFTAFCPREKAVEIALEKIYEIIAGSSEGSE